MSTQGEMPGWARALFIIFGLLSVVIAFTAMFRPLITLELVLILIPIVLVITGIGWIIHGAVGK